MGRELCLATILVPNGGLDFTAARTAVAALEPEELHEIMANAHGEIPEEYLTDDDRFSVAGAASARSELLDAVAEIERWQECRDIASLTVPGGTLLVTGGMTWGDDPTDSYTQFHLLGWATDVYQALTRQAENTTTDAQALDSITKLLDGHDWHAGEIADIVRETGRTIGEAA
ncbi:MAG TPA: hypothetical protein VN193_02735 [Candidatus Angelobacter sp.]|jgi:hypothetical protein|nr:hypothetical protein [Candidatus Angelobacter sp.]